MFAPITATVTMDTEVPREYVWRAFESAPRWPEVLQDIESAQVEPNGRLEAGAVMRSRAVPDTRAVDMAYNVLEAEHPHRLVIQSSAVGFSAHTEYRFAEGAHGGTRITINGTVAAHKLSMRAFIAVKRKPHTQLIEGSLHRRMSSMLELAEKIWKEERPA